MNKSVHGGENLQEKDLYLPVKNYFISNGYKVRGEVKGYDIVATKEDERIVVIELKKQFSVKLLTQAIKAQRIADEVYVAIPKPNDLKIKGKWKDNISLVRRMEIGLLFVDTIGENLYVEVVTEPKPFKPRVTKAQKRKRTHVIKEVAERHEDYNVGGSRGVPLVTAYRQKAVHLACLLENYGTLSTKELRGYGADSKTTSSILYQNHYGWFDRVDRGTYSLTSKGEKGLEEFEELANYFRQLIKEEVQTNGTV